MLACTAVWFVRNQSLMEMWWTFLSLARYPRTIYQGQWARPFGWVVTFLVPIAVAVSVPAETMVKTLDPWFISWAVFASVVMFAASRGFLRLSLRAYRSASS
jgi:ABC-2 type transport system permease protein